MKRLVVILLAVLGLVTLSLAQPVLSLTWNLAWAVGRAAFALGRWARF